MADGPDWYDGRVSQDDLPASGEGESSLTRLIADSLEGVPGAEDRLYPLIYDELRGLAAYIHGARPGDSLCPTEIVNEAYLRLTRQRGSNLRDRAHFFCIAARIIRRVLVDYARARNAQKRGGLAERTTLSAVVDARAIQPGLEQLDVLALEEALDELSAESPVRAQVVELRFFAGLGVRETADALGVHEMTVKRHWKFARAWLYARMSGSRESS